MAENELIRDRLFVLQVVIAHEDQWFKPETNVVLRTERQYSIDAMLFAAADEHDAYKTATDWLENDGFSDANCDGYGDITRIFSVGIHQLEEVASLSDFADKSRDTYGLTLPNFWLPDIDSDDKPRVRQKDELQAFWSAM